MSIFIFFIIIVVGIILFAFTSKSTKADDKQPSQQTVQKQSQSLRPKIIIESGTSNAPVQELKYFCIKDKGYHVSVWPKDQGFEGIDYIEFHIAGITHGEHIDDHLGEFIATLEPDPTNPYDTNAIKIVTREGHRIGYVPKDQTVYVRDFTSIPCRCYCYIGTNDGMYFTDCYITRNDQ